ncbi:hypothetical protein [Nonomuraea jabiensis]|uniref:hypothetical protein n=1 Tax=Nonomuraea jabiensis TaxID=882448 RepID=UPI003D75B72D
MLTATTIAVLAWLIRDVADLDAATDWTRKTIPGGSPQDLTSTLVDYDDDSTVAWPAGTPMSPLLQRYLSSRTSLSGDDGLTESESASIGQELSATAATVARQTFGLFLTSKRRQPIRIVNIVPVELRRGPVYDQALALLPPQGGENSATMVFNLDEAAPRAHAVKDNDITKVRGPFFPAQTLPVPEDKQEPILIHFWITRGSLSFKLRIDYLLGDQPHSMTIGDEGQPIRLTAYNCTGPGRASYERAIAAGGTHIEPVKNPRRMRVSDC